MYLTKAVIFNEKDLPVLEREIESDKCPKCGSEIGLVKSIQKEKLNTFDFLKRFGFYYQILEDKKVFIGSSSRKYYDFISLTEIKNFIDKEDFENSEDVKKLIDLFKEHNVPYVIDIVVADE